MGILSFLRSQCRRAAATPRSRAGGDLWAGLGFHQPRGIRLSALYPAANTLSIDPFADADEDTGQTQATQQEYLHIRIQRESLPRRPVGAYRHPHNSPQVRHATR